jgi:hypothetical protein
MDIANLIEHALSSQVVGNVAALASMTISAATMGVGLFVFRRQERKSDQVQDLQFVTTHRKTLSELLEPIVDADRKHLFHASELLSALEQAAYCYNHQIVGKWAQDSMRREFVSILKLSLSDPTIMGLAKHGGDRGESHRELLAFMRADKRTFAGELRTILTVKETGLRPFGPRFSLIPWGAKGGREGWVASRAARRRATA